MSVPTNLGRRRRGLRQPRQGMPALREKCGGHGPWRARCIALEICTCSIGIGEQDALESALTGLVPDAFVLGMASQGNLSELTQFARVSRRSCGSSDCSQEQPRSDVSLELARCPCSIRLCRRLASQGLDPDQMCAADTLPLPHSVHLRWLSATATPRGATSHNLLSWVARPIAKQYVASGSSIPIACSMRWSESCYAD